MPFHCYHFKEYFLKQENFCKPRKQNKTKLLLLLLFQNKFEFFVWAILDFYRIAVSGPNTWYIDERKTWWDWIVSFRAGWRRGMPREFHSRRRRCPQMEERSTASRFRCQVVQIETRKKHYFSIYVVKILF